MNNGLFDIAFNIINGYNNIIQEQWDLKHNKYKNTHKMMKEIDIVFRHNKLDQEKRFKKFLKPSKYHPDPVIIDV